MTPDPHAGPSRTRHAREPEPKLAHRALRDTLMSILDVDPAASAAFNSRLRRTVGMLRDGVSAPRRRTPNRRYDVLSLLEIALALQLQRGYVEPSAASRLVTRWRAALPALWRRVLIERDGFLLQVPVDALNTRARVPPGEDPPAVPEDMLQGRTTGSGAPMLTVDLELLAQRAVDALGKSGWTERDVLSAVAGTADGMPGP